MGAVDCRADQGEGVADDPAAGLRSRAVFPNSCGQVSHSDGETLARPIETAIKHDVIPLLLRGLSRPSVARELAHDLAVTSEPPSADEITELARQVQLTDIAPALALVAAVRARGVDIESVYLNLLAPAARRLGEWWSDDRCDFAVVTMGVGQLHAIMRLLVPEFQASAAPAASGHSAVMISAPGAQHSFGAAMLAEFFRRAGWMAWNAAPASLDELISLMRRSWFSIVGLSVATDRHLSEVPAQIRAVRRESRNRSVGIMVGGPAFAADPGLFARMGADGTAVDARQAVHRAALIANMLGNRR